jgi:hypothetical protein
VRVRDSPPHIVDAKSQPLAGGGELVGQNQSNADGDQIKEEVKDRCAESIDRAPDARQQGICACAHLRDPTRFLVEPESCSPERRPPTPAGVRVDNEFGVDGIWRGTLPVAQASLA